MILYFGCVTNILNKGYENGFNNFACLSPCQQIDYTAWQDINELPDNIFPKLIESNIDDFENIKDNFNNNFDEIDENFKNDTDEYFTCQINQILNDKQIQRIKNEAYFAYEKQVRYQENILLRTKRLIDRFRQSSNKCIIFFFFNKY